MLQHLKIDYTELYRPPLDLPRLLTDEFNKVLESGDAAAIDKYYRKVILPYGYSADLEKEQLEEWDREASSKRHKENGAQVSDSILERHARWQEEAEDIWKYTSDLSIPDTAKRIAEHEDHSWHTIKKYIKKDK